MAISMCKSLVDSSGRELLVHGTADFPIACYHDDLSQLEVPWHWHDELEAALVTEGSATVAAGSRKYTLRAGEAFFINAQVLHGCWELDHSGCRFHSIAFHPRLIGGSADSVFHSKYIQPLIENRALPSLHLTPQFPRQAAAISAIERAWQACAQEESGYEIIVRNALSELILLLQDLPSVQDKSPVRDQRSAARIKQMLSFIHAHYADELSCRRIAESAAISESECLRCFQSQIGATPIQYLRQYRIQRSAQLLLNTDESISDIAASCGFQDLSYFTKTFRRIKGCTPSAYRKQR